MASGTDDMWEEKLDPNSGRKYFFNPVKRESAWVLPAGASLAQAGGGGQGNPADGARGEGEWEERVDPATKKVYYYNRQRRKSAWVKPEGFNDGRVLADGLPDDWQAKKDPASGRTFYYSAARRESSWSPPPGSRLASSMSPSGPTEGSGGGGGDAGDWLAEVESLVAECPDGVLNKVMRGWDLRKVAQFVQAWPAGRVATVLQGWDPERQAAIVGGDGVGVEVVVECLRRWGFDSGIEVVPRLAGSVAAQVLTALYEEERVWRALHASAALSRLPAGVAAQACASWDPYNAARVLRKSDPATRAQVLANFDPATKDNVMRALQEVDEAGDDDDEEEEEEEEVMGEEGVTPMTPSTPAGAASAAAGGAGGMRPPPGAVRMPGMPAGAVAIPGMGGRRPGGAASAMQSELAARLASRG